MKEILGVDKYMAPMEGWRHTPSMFAGSSKGRAPYAIVEINSVFETRQI